MKPSTKGGFFVKGALLGKLEDRFFKHKSHKRFFTVKALGI